MHDNEIIVPWPITDAPGTRAEFTSSHRLVAQGAYPLTWAGSDEVDALSYPD
jgi:hypothetical protein